MKVAIGCAFRRAGVTVALASLAFLAPLAFSQTDVQKDGYEKLLGTVKALSASLQREPGATSGDARATLARVAARQKEAEDLAAVGEYGVARSILDEGYRSLTQTLGSMKSGSGFRGETGSEASIPGGGGNAARKASYERQIGTAQALLDAAKRASVEMRGAKSAEISRIEAMLAKARGAATSGDHAQADTTAAEALKELRTLMVSMKGGNGEPKAAASSSDGVVDPATPIAAFDSRYTTTKALLDALRRQNSEKNGGKENVIADIETRLARTRTLLASDPKAAAVLLDDAYALVRSTLQSMQGTASLKSGSAALEESPAVESSTTADGQRAQAQRSLDSAKAIRNAAERIGREKGFDNAATLTTVDTLATDARSHLASDPARALKSATEANRLAKEALQKAQTER
jgi:hypothetical protein